jgi:hypothetical protein
LDQLLLNNTDRVLDLDAALPRLLLCNPAQGEMCLRMPYRLLLNVYWVLPWR